MKHFLLIFLLGWSYTGICQWNDSTNIYLLSLTQHLDYLKSMSKGKLQSVFVEKSDLIDALPEKINNVSVTYLTWAEIRERTQKGKGINLIVIKPVKIDVGSLKVTIIDFFVTSKKKNFNYANGGGSTLVFKYNCELQKFELTQKKQGGI